MHKNQIISQLIQKKIITISPDKPFTYASGMLSPIYTDLRLTVSYPELRDMIASDLANLIAKKFPETTIIGGVATAGIPHGALVAEKLHLPMIYVRPKPKDHGKGRQIEGRFSLMQLRPQKKTVDMLLVFLQFSHITYQTLKKTSRKLT